MLELSWYSPERDWAQGVRVWTDRERQRDCERDVSGCGLSERQTVSAMCQGVDCQRETVSAMCQGVDSQIETVSAMCQGVDCQRERE